MGAVAGPNIIVLMLTAMEHDLQYRINFKMDTSMMLSMRSIFLGTQKSSLLQQMSQVDSEKNKGRYNQLAAMIQQIEARERQIAALEKQLEMEMKALENQLKKVQQRKEGAQKMLDQNIKGAFDYGQG